MRQTGTPEIGQWGNLGIRATLSTTAVTRVMIGNNGYYQTVVVRRDPQHVEGVALAAPAPGRLPPAPRRLESWLRSSDREPRDPPPRRKSGAGGRSSPTFKMSNMGTCLRETVCVIAGAGC